MGHVLRCSTWRQVAVRNVRQAAMKKIKSLKSDLPEDTVPSLVILTVIAVRHVFLMISWLTNGVTS